MYALDLSAGNCAVIGRQSAGKTTALATMITGAALMYHPMRVQFVVIALGGTALNAVEKLPHVSSFAFAGDRERIQRNDRRDAAVGGGTGGSIRPVGPDVGDVPQPQVRQTSPVRSPRNSYGEVFLVIDGWQQFRATCGEDILTP